MKAISVLLGFFSSIYLVAAAPDPTPQQEPVSAQQKGSVIRVNSTNQSYDFFRPWNKQAPGGRRGTCAPRGRGGSPRGSRKKRQTAEGPGGNDPRGASDG